MKPLFPLVAALVLGAAADVSTQQAGHQFTVLHLNNRLGELNPCG